jgi:hypothetical protein
MDIQTTMDFILEQQAQVAALQMKNELEIAKIEAILRRAVRLAVQEARNERQKRREVDGRCKERTERLEANLDRLTEDMRRGRNGGSRNPGPSPEAS